MGLLKFITQIYGDNNLNFDNSNIDSIIYWVLSSKTCSCNFFKNVSVKKRSSYKSKLKSKTQSNFFSRRKNLLFNVALIMTGTLFKKSKKHSVFALHCCNDK